MRWLWNMYRTETSNWSLGLVEINVVIHRELHIYTCLILPVSHRTFLRNAMPPFTCSKILRRSSSLNRRVNSALMIAFDDCNSKTNYIYYLTTLWSQVLSTWFHRWINQTKLQEAQVGLEAGYFVFTALQCSLPPVWLSPKHLSYQVALLGAPSIQRAAKRETGCRQTGGRGHTTSRCLAKCFSQLH